MKQPKTLEQLLEERKKLLEDHPELASLQVEIDNILKNTINPSQRMDIISMLMQEKLEYLREQFLELVNIASKYSNGKPQ